MQTINAVLETRLGFRKSMVVESGPYVDLPILNIGQSPFYSEEDFKINKLVHYTKVRFVFKEWIVPFNIALYKEEGY